MNAKERLEIYEKALEDWCMPKSRNTSLGFCFYFSRKSDLDLTGAIRFELFLPELYSQRITNGPYHYNGCGSTELGRFERVVALKNAIKEVKLLIEKEDESR